VIGVQKGPPLTVGFTIRMLPPLRAPRPHKIHLCGHNFSADRENLGFQTPLEQLPWSMQVSSNCRLVGGCRHLSQPSLVGLEPDLPAATPRPLVAVVAGALRMLLG